MDFGLTDEQGFIQETIRKFMARECPREVARDLDDRGRFPGKLLRAIAELGLCALNASEEYGGGDKDLLGSIVVVEELSAMCPPLAAAFSGVTLRGGRIIAEFGNDDQKRRFLPAIAQGALLFTYALIEPVTDVSSDIKTTAMYEDGAFVLNGSKSFVGLASRANYILTLARTDQAVDIKQGLAFLLVDAAAPGVQIREIEKVGYRGASLCEVLLNNVAIPEDDLLGGVGQLNRGWEQSAFVLALEQIEAAAFGLGIAQGAYDYGAAYARERVQFGQPIAQFEAIQHMFVDMAVAIRASRLLLYQACWLCDQGLPFAVEAAVAQLSATEIARKAALQCLHILGGYGYTMEYDAQRYVRDSLGLLDGIETAEFLKSRVGALLGLSVAPDSVYA
ncbi:MAG: acyl-CoA dehydrogenase family protein [Ardenticatenaceae bacterium]|nr:acyl-CoA dehydrogenase family protein [Ardenticatenaceae bacterium]